MNALFELIDRVAKTREPVEITKRGKTKVRLVPAPAVRVRGGCGIMRGTFEILCSEDELVAAQPLNVLWNAKR
jgi:antitoxin (DNA-binding transcriptional repressor) of toxin-antitoxin stability system